MEEQVRQLENKVKMLEGLIFNLVRSDRYTVAKDVEILNGRKIQLGTSEGTQMGTATDQKLAVLGSTPIIQQTTTSQTPASFVSNSSDIADDTATWGGYTMGDIVAILQAFGFIA